MAQGRPAVCATTHRIGKIALTVSNYGTIGSYFLGYSRWTKDCFTGERAVSCEYPRGSNTEYLFGGAIWLGGVVGTDTLVSTGSDGWGYGIKHSIDVNGWRHRGMEWAPDESPFGDIKKRTIMDQLSDDYENAVSEEDIIAVYTDTFPNGMRGLTYDEFDGRPHKPLNVQITQTSYAWSYPYAEDFILFNLELENFGSETIKDSYLGLLIDGDIYGEGNQGPGSSDDLAGYLPTVTTEYGGCEYTDTVNMAWMADNEGDWSKSVPVTSVVGTRILKAPYKTHKNPSFNWWVPNTNPLLDFGPREKNSPDNPFRDWRTGGLGTPEGDRNKYAMLRNGEVDYDVAYMKSITPDDPIWLLPRTILSKYYTRGQDTRYLQSVGPFDIRPNQRTTITFAFVAAENFHTFHKNFRYYLQPGFYYPDQFYENLGFEEFGKNAIWASWVYDNPGVDTDSNDFYGKYRLCCNDSVISSIDTSDFGIDTVWDYSICDTVWYEGDGRPDFRGATPPPAPRFWVYPTVGEISIRWNGMRSETTPDVFTRQIDFDGYRVYISRDSRPESFVLLASCDLENYNRYRYVESENTFIIYGEPLSRDDIVCLYGDSCNDPVFDPRDYTRQSPLVYGDSIFYFKAQDFNRSELGLNTPITKIYPDAPEPIYRDPANVPDSLVDELLTEDGYFKYYEYQFTIDNLLPTVPYFVNVTAFDFGSPSSGLGALETARNVNAIETYPLPTDDEVAEKDLDVYIYPNPYRIDGNYLADGFEGRDARWNIPERLRLIHFANLPPKCWIRIYSLDGDLIRALRHDKDPEDPMASHDTWDMITRNTQALVSGVYYWTVEDDNGRTQIGKLVVIK